MPELGKKYTCYSCHTKFYDLGKPEPLCPKCKADQRDADEAPAYTAPRGRARVVEEPVEEEEFTPAASPEPSDEEGEDAFVAVDDDREEEAEEEEEEY
ncbi:MAG: FYDLN acid domain-containing protein [Thermoanaerobaculia bacterium]